MQKWRFGFHITTLFADGHCIIARRQTNLPSALTFSTFVSH
jgi:hypothetical protein